MSACRWPAVAGCARPGTGRHRPGDGQENPAPTHGLFSPASQESRWIPRVSSLVMHVAASTGRMVAGRYLLQHTIGRGAMGTVWRARDTVLARDVAVKEVRLRGPVTGNSVMTEETRILYQRTLREARTAARLNHPAVVTIFDVVEADGSPWIVMELVEARSLDQVLTEDGPLRPRQATDLGMRVLGALACAHAAGILHRDVKPSNVLLGPDSRVVLTDFGIATLEGDSGLTQAGMVMGTPGFTAPERIRGRSGQLPLLTCGRWGRPCTPRWRGAGPSTTGATPSRSWRRSPTRKRRGPSRPARCATSSKPCCTGTRRPGRTLPRPPGCWPPPVPASPPAPLPPPEAGPPEGAPPEALRPEAAPPEAGPPEALRLGTPAGRPPGPAPRCSPLRWTWPPPGRRPRPRPTASPGPRLPGRTASGPVSRGRGPRRLKARRPGAGGRNPRDRSPWDRNPWAAGNLPGPRWPERSPGGMVPPPGDSGGASPLNWR